MIKFTSFDVGRQKTTAIILRIRCKFTGYVVDVFSRIQKQQDCISGAFTALTFMIIILANTQKYVKIEKS